jgi:hypothetical protein
MKPIIKLVLAVTLTAAFIFEIEPSKVVFGLGVGPSDAQARVGRPLTPGSVAGVARRTTRRTIRRGAYYGALPRGCGRVTVYGYAVWDCRGQYYQSSGSGYVIIYF